MHYPRLSPHIVAFDTLRSSQALGQDLLADQPYGHLCQAALDGRVRLVCGGPNCRTWSILRWFPKPNAPLPVRGRSEDLVWGLEALQPAEQLNVDNDSLLVLWLMFLISLMKKHTQVSTASFLEHPQDPVECSESPSAHRCSSLWATKVFQAWQPTVGHHLVKFDECRLGQLVAKATTISSDLDICCWDGLKCNHPRHVLPEDMKSSDLSRYPPPMMLGLAGAISKTLRDIGGSSSKPTISWETSAPSNPRVVHRDPASDRSVGISNQTTPGWGRQAISREVTATTTKNLLHGAVGGQDSTPHGPRRSACPSPVVRNTTLSQMAFFTRFVN